MKRNLKRRDYHKCERSVAEIMPIMGKAVLGVGFLALFFYRSIWAVFPLSVVGYLFARMEMRKRVNRIKKDLTLQFKECILSVSASLKAGYAVENAFLESRGDMKMLFGEDSYIYHELELIRRGLVINITLEEQLADLAERSGSEEIMQFASVFTIAKRSGGSLPEIIRDSAELISQRIDAGQEMHTILSGKCMEQNIMKCMPFAVILYIGISSPGYFDGLYGNIQGVAVMTMCLVIYLAAYVMGEKILRRIFEEMA